jgi:hypothetical protein
MRKRFNLRFVFKFFIMQVNMPIVLRFVQILKTTAIHRLTIFELNKIQATIRSTFHKRRMTIVRIFFKYILALPDIAFAYYRS